MTGNRLLLNDARDALEPRGIYGSHSPRAERVRIPLTAQAVATQAFRQNQVLVIENVATDKRVHRLLRAGGGRRDGEEREGDADERLHGRPPVWSGSPG